MIISRYMKRLYVPYLGRRPAPVELNGHRLLIFGQSHEMFENNLSQFSADRIREIILDTDDESQVLGQLARRARADVILAPLEADLDDVLRGLSNQLPWVH
jgi:hypothetical protein